MTLCGQVHIVHGVEFTAHLLSVQEVGADEGALLLVLMSQFLRLLDAAGAHGGSHIALQHAFADVGRCDDRMLGCLPPQHSVAWAFFTSRAMPMPMQAALA